MSDPSSNPPLAPPESRLATLSPGWRVWLACALALAVLLALLWGAGLWARDRAMRDLRSQAQASAQLSLTALGHKLDKFRAIPRILAQDTALIDILQAPSPDGQDRLNRRLEALAQSLGAAILYVMRADGDTLAASNWQEPDSFVGHDYRFRPYYRDAITFGQASHFALGTVSREPGLYLARRVDGPGGPLGVVVLKIGFQDLESVWTRSGMPQFVTDAQRVVLLGYPADWHYHVIRPLPSAHAARVRESLQFGAAPLDPLPIDPPLDDDASHPVALVRLTQAQAGLRAGALLLHVEQPVPGMPGWHLHLLRPVSSALDAAALTARVIVLLVVLLSSLAGWGLARRHRRAARLLAARQALESEVRLRTRELWDANARLQAEIDDHRRTEARLHEMQDELVQANRLSLLGQVAAGVAHEINQPVGAIRTYADNTGEFLRRGQLDRVRDNLAAITRLTERIGGITQELRAFSRKRAARIEAIDLDAALAGALLLIGPRLDRLGVDLRDLRERPSPRVRADSMRLEQVFVNLLYNALEALEDCPQPQIVLSVNAVDGQVSVRIADNGRGIDLTTRERLFTPFYTTRAQGVGLGLVISRDIVTEFGGTLQALETDRGAIFEVLLMCEESQT
ncbi:MAG: GHKL domain-containing protein [Castellaniella sp.]|nr:GHKL domain-containing protein [Castellaniella sp.]